MTISVINRKVSLVFLVMLFSFSCSKNGESPKNDEDGFDKAAMLLNYADNLIIPAYTQMSQKLPELEASINTFLSDPNEINQQALKVVFTATYLQFERISCLHFGPAESILLNNFINMLPANTMKKDGIDKPDLTIVEENIASGHYDLTLNSTLHQQGLPVLDYLLFSTDALSKFSTPESTNRKKYVQDLMSRMKALLDQTLSTWKSNYRGQFIANTKSDSGSPISFMVNQFAYEMDMIKGPRIGWPFGTQSGGIPYPEKCEGYYAGISQELAIENMLNLKKTFTGADSGKGIADLLAAIGKGDLKSEVLSQFDVVVDKLKAIPAPLSDALVNNKPAVEDASREIQTLLTLIKTDVVSALGVQISYVDNDGD